MASQDRNLPADARPPPKSGLDPMEPDDKVKDITKQMKSDAEAKMGQSYSEFQPVLYVKKGGVQYCIRVGVDGGQWIDVCGQYGAGRVRKVNAREITDTKEPMTFF